MQISNPPACFPILERKAHDIIAFHHGVEIETQTFLNMASALARRLPDQAYVFNLCTNRFHYLLGFCAAAIAGQCTLMPPNRLPATVHQLGEEYPDNYSLTDEDVASWNDLREHSDDNGSFTIPAIPSDQLCAIAFTSGSTGSPTPNLKYWETLQNSTIGNAQLLLPDDHPRLNLLATVPPQHMWGLETSILLPLFADVSVSDQTPFYPQDIADALAAMPKPRVLVSSPVHLNVLFKSNVPLTELNYIFSATAPMSQCLAAKLEKQYSTRVIEIFGSSESGIVARRSTSSETLWQLSDLFTLKIKDDGVSIQAPHLPAEVFIHDVMELVGNRHFNWLGRHQDMLNIAGKRGSLADLNRRLMAVKGVVDGVVFLPSTNAERVAAMVVAPDSSARDIFNALKSEVESIFLPRPIVMVESLPRQATGKLANRDILQKFAELTSQSASHKIVEK